MVNDTEFETRISVTPSRDHRFDPEKWRRGCTSMRLEFTLIGPLGAVTTWVSTGWMYEPLTEIPAEFGRGWTGPWTNPKRATGEVGPDAFRRDSHHPDAGAISCHAAKPPAGKEDYFTASDGCTLIEGGTCFGDTGYLVGDTFLARLAQGGSDAGFAYLREIHDDWLAAEVVSA